MEIDQAQAKEIAESAARRDWQAYMTDNDQFFIPQVFSAKSAWMFIRNPEIQIPDHMFLSKRSYVVSKSGTLRVFEEVYPDETECQRIVDYMSEYFDEKGI